MSKRKVNVLYFTGIALVSILLVLLLTMMLYNNNNKKRDMRFIEVNYVDNNYYFINDEIIKYEIDLDNLSDSTDYTILDEREVYYLINEDSTVLLLGSDFEVEIIRLIDEDRLFVRIIDLKQVIDFRFANDTYIKLGK